MAKQIILEPTEIILPPVSQKVAYLYGGPPVVGKDAQTEACERLGIPVLKMGPVLKEIAASEPGGLEDQAIKSGKLASDSLTIWTTKRWILKHNGHQIIKLNGVPRTVPQMVVIDFLREHGFTPKFIWFTTPLEECLARPVRAGRIEDLPEKRLERMEVYRRQTMPVFDQFERYGISEENKNLLTIDNSLIQKHQVAEMIINFFKLPYQVFQLFPATDTRMQETMA